MEPQAKKSKHSENAENTKNWSDFEKLFVDTPHITRQVFRHLDRNSIITFREVCRAAKAFSDETLHGARFQVKLLRSRYKVSKIFSKVKLMRFSVIGPKSCEQAEMLETMLQYFENSENIQSIKKFVEFMDKFCQDVKNIETPLEKVIRDENIELLDQFIQILTENGRMCNFEEYFSFACYHGKVKAIDYFIKNHTVAMDFDSPVQTFHPDFSPLQLAVQNGQVEVVKLLLANFRNCGIHPHRITKNTNENLLHLACGSPNTTKELIETLLDREPFDKMLGNSKWIFFENLIPETIQSTGVNGKNKNGRTAFQVACLTKNIIAQEALKDNAEKYDIDLDSHLK